MAKLLLFLLVVACCMSLLFAGTDCWSSGWGGCNDGGCYRNGGYCINFGRPPNNDCRCVPQDYYDD